MLKYRAVGEYQTRTTVESSAGRPSNGRYCEKPRSTAACAHAASSSTPSTRSASAGRGAATDGGAAVTFTSPSGACARAGPAQAKTRQANSRQAKNTHTNAGSARPEEAE